MNTSTIEARRMPAKRLGLFALGLAVACAGMFGLGATKAEASASNDPFTMQLNDGLMDLGFAFDDQEILPAPSSVAQRPNTPLPSWWDVVESVFASGGTSNCIDPSSQTFPCGANPANATISAVNGNGFLFPASGAVPATAWPDAGNYLGTSTYNPGSGAITLNRVVQAAGSPSGTPFNYDVRFPIMAVPQPGTQNTDVPLTIAATGEVTGTYSGGSLTLTPTPPSYFEARIIVGLALTTPEPFTYCSVKLPNMTMSTGNGTAFNGTPFAFGLGGKGAFQGSTTISAATDITPVKQGAGPQTLNSDPGTGDAGLAALWSACGQGNASAAVKAVAEGAFNLWLGNRVDVPKCADDQIGTYPDCIDPKADITKIQVTGSKSVKKGKKVKLTVKVTNSGTADESVKLRLWSSNGGVATVTGQTTVEAVAGGTTTKKVTVTAKKKKGKTTIHATNGAKTGKLTVKVK